MTARQMKAGTSIHRQLGIRETSSSSYEKIESGESSSPICSRASTGSGSGWKCGSGAGDDTCGAGSCHCSGGGGGATGCCCGGEIGSCRSCGGWSSCCCGGGSNCCGGGEIGSWRCG